MSQSYCYLRSTVLLKGLPVLSVEDLGLMGLVDLNSEQSRPLVLVQQMGWVVTSVSTLPAAVVAHLETSR